jgi:hypothetical protein
MNNIITSPSIADLTYAVRSAERALLSAQYKLVLAQSVETYRLLGAEVVRTSEIHTALQNITIEALNAWRAVSDEDQTGAWSIARKAWATAKENSTRAYNDFNTAYENRMLADRKYTRALKRLTKQIQSL